MSCKQRANGYDLCDSDLQSPHGCHACCRFSAEGPVPWAGNSTPFARAHKHTHTRTRTHAHTRTHTPTQKHSEFGYTASTAKATAKWTAAQRVTVFQYTRRVLKQQGAKCAYTCACAVLQPLSLEFGRFKIVVCRQLECHLHLCLYSCADMRNSKCLQT